MKKLLLFIAILISGMGLFAQNIGDNTVIDYDGYSLKYTVTSTNPAECEVVCSTHPSSLTGIAIPSSVIISGKEFSITSIGDEAFSYCSNLTSIEIPNSVTSIGDYAFYFCSGLTSIEIPASLTYFGQDAITGCSNITSIIVEEGNSVYDSRNNCNAVIETATNTLVAGCKETVIPNTVTSIGFAAFSGCLNLTSIEIPSSVSYIHSYGFFQCYELKSLYCYAENVPEIDGSVFDGGVPSDMTIYVPAQSVDAYKASYPWNEYTIKAIEGKYKLQYTVTSTDPAECEVVCSEQPDYPTTIEIPSKVVIVSEGNQTEIVVGETSSSSPFIPTHEYYNYSVTQQIYTSDEINADAGAITSIAFRQTESVSDTRNLEVYMLNTNVDYFENNNSWFNVTSENLVFSGNVDYPAVAGEWLNLEFQKQFLYEGGNVVVCVVDKTGSWTNGKSFDTFETGNYRTLFTYRDDSAYDLTNLSSSNTTMTSEVNVVKFNHVEGDVYDVTSIGYEAFRACENLTGVIIPNTVNNISEYAFADCSSLSFINCSAENVPETAENAFEGVPSDMKVSVPTQSIDVYKATLPWSNFMVVGPYELQFTITSTEPAECEVRCLLKPTTETTLTIPSTVTIDDVVYSVTSIADSAFLGCDKFIGDLVIPNTVRSVGVRAFRDCVGFDGTLTLSENLETIGDLAFAGGYDVNVNYTGKLTIPNSVEYIGMAAFQNCSSLTSLEFEEGSQITSLEQNVFRNCSSLTGNLQIPNSVTSIGDYAFSGCYNLTGDLLIPNSVTSVGVEAFWECRGFDGTLTLSENLEVINDKAFASYEGQMGFWGTLVIPSGVRTIGQAAFQNCSNLSLLEIEEGSQLETIDHWAFTQCYSLGGDLLIPNTVTYIGDYAFYNTSINSLNFEENSQLNSIGNYAFQYCYNLSGDLIIPATVTSVGNAAFHSCTLLTSIEIPASVTYIGERVFNWDSNITSITVDEENTVYDSRNNCNAIIETSTNKLISGCTNTIIPNTVTSIGVAAFGGYGLLTSIEIPSSVTYIEDEAFSQCYELRNVYCHAVNVPEAGWSVFSGVPSDMVIHVPAPSLEAYQNTYPWSDFTIMPMETTNHWTPDESIYANNMTIIGEVQINGVSQNSAWLEVGAFCGEEVRGAQMVQYVSELDKYEVFLMIYGEANDEIIFKLYDHSAKEELDLISPDAVTFAVNGTLGSVETPYVLNFISSEQQIRNLKSGWNWFSSYIELEGGEGLEMMEDALGENGLQIKNQSAFVTNSSSGWYGSLTSVSVQDMFMIETSDTVIMTLEGPKVNPEDYEFSLGQGWKWISYPVSESLSVEDALANIYPNHGDNIKSQTAFSQYYNGIGWIGGLNTMNPGEGYMYRNSSDETKTLVYPSSSESKGALKANATADNNHWIPNVGQFANNMNLIAVVENNSETDYEIGAFVGDEVRGSARPIYIEALDSYMIFMTIFGEGNEEFSFKYYDLNAKEENVFTEENIIFSANAVFGSVDNPVVMMFDTEGLDENGMENVSIYPNPAAVNSEINLGMTCERVEIYNTLGVKVAEYSDVDKIDGMETSGVYVIRVINDNEMRNYRMVVK
ncbi:MAG: leucine-rich repeat protein [Bacteroidales bacterium]|nr:leucine-rich repeat protein [Bacteroidales bacterium]